MRAAEKASSAAARDAAALEYTLGLDVCTDVAARKHVFFFFFFCFTQACILSEPVHLHVCVCA